MKTRRQIRQWLLFCVLVAIALYLHVQYPIESVVGPAPDESTVDSSDTSTSDPGNPVLPKAAVPPKSAGLRGTTHASADTSARLDSMPRETRIVDTTSSLADAVRSAEPVSPTRPMPLQWSPLSHVGSLPVEPATS